MMRNNLCDGTAVLAHKSKKSGIHFFYADFCFKRTVIGPAGNDGMLKTQVSTGGGPHMREECVHPPSPCASTPYAQGEGRGGCHKEIDLVYRSRLFHPIHFISSVSPPISSPFFFFLSEKVVREPPWRRPKCRRPITGPALKARWGTSLLHVLFRYTSLTVQRTQSTSYQTFSNENSHLHQWSLTH